MRNRRSFFPIILALVTVLTASLNAQTFQYPKTRKVDVVDDYHGIKVPDPYRWLEDTSSPETAEWVKAQNAISLSYLRSLPEREKFHRRLTQLWNYPKYGVPFKQAGLYFSTRNSGLQNQDVLYVQESLHAEPRVLIDPNGFSADGTVALSGYSVSEDGRLIAYGVSSAGSDWKEIRVREVSTARDRKDLLKWVKWTGMTWTHDHRGFFYSRYPQPSQEKEAYLEANRNQKLYYHVVGTPQEEDILVHERPDQPEWGIGAELSEDGRYLLLYLTHGSSPKRRVHYMDLGDPLKPNLKAPVVKLRDEFDAAYDFLGHDGPLWYFKTDRDAARGRVVAIDITRPEPDAWRTVLPECADTLEAVSLAGNLLIADYLKNASTDIRVYELPSPQGKRTESAKLKSVVRLPTLGSAGGFGGKRQEMERFYSFTSFLYPPTVFRYDVKSGRSELYKQPSVDFDPKKFETKQVWYASKDGTRIPMFIVHRKGLKKDGSNPTYLYGYGGFNVSQTPGFSVSRLIWMENGGVFAMPNLRGGGEFGEEWHQAGTKLRKQNVFDDFIAAAEFLIREGYTSPGHLAIAGGSNGGLLVGAVMNQRPELFAAAIPAVGVMDMLRYHLFTIGWAWKSDYGSSEDPEELKALLAYSPLHNIRKGVSYPATLVTTGDHDDRVVPGHSFKYAAALQEAQAGDKPVLIRIETRAGHGAGKPTAKIIDEAADVWAFAMHHTGLRWSLP